MRADPPVSLASGQVDLWVVRDARVRDAALLQRWQHSLSPEERARIAGMHFPDDRHQQLVTRGLLREVLSGYSPAVAPGDWRFERNEHGKPRIALGGAVAVRDLHFNLAHTAGMVVLAVSHDVHLGVDVEHRDRPAPLKVARRHFSPPEVLALDGLPPEQQPLRFLRLWTLKEAYLKAIGTGVVGGLGTMTFHLDGQTLRFERAADPDAARWRFREFELPEGYRVALAMLADVEQPEVSLREFGSGEEQRSESQ